MIELKIFVFNLFQVNTYVLYKEAGDAVIIDPACYEPDEEKELSDFINVNKLNPVLLLNTHAHVDHIVGNNFIFRQFGLKPWLHEASLPFLNNATNYGKVFGMNIQEVIQPDRFLVPGETIPFDRSLIKVLYTPGHVDGSVCFYVEEQSFAVVGDVIFFESIGRTDLPTGNYPLLVNSIKDELFTLPDETILYPGHGHETTVGHEKKFNPFLNEELF